MKVLITGGHITPALAVLMSLRTEIVIVGRSRFASDTQSLGIQRDTKEISDLLI